VDAVLAGDLQRADVGGAAGPGKRQPEGDQRANSKARAERRAL